MSSIVIIGRVLSVVVSMFAYGYILAWSVCNWKTKPAKIFTAVNVVAVLAFFVWCWIR